MLLFFRSPPFSSLHAASLWSRHAPLQFYLMTLSQGWRSIHLYLLNYFWRINFFSVSNLTHLKKTMLSNDRMLIHFSNIVLLEGRLSIWHIIHHLLPVSIFYKCSFLWFYNKRVNLNIASSFDCKSTCQWIFNLSSIF